MNEYLYELALRKAGEILRKVSAASLEPLREHALREWVEYLPPPEEIGSVAAVDGSHNTIEFKAFTLYALLAYGLTSDLVAGEASVRLVGDVDVLQPPGVPDMIQLYRELAEAVAAYLVSGADLLMVDGSVRALLIHPRPLANTGRLNRALTKVEELMGEGFYENLWERVRDRLRALEESDTVVDPFVSKEVVRDHGLVSAEYMDAAALIGYLEKLMVIRALLERKAVGARRRGLVYVSKTSRSQLYFREVIRAENVVPVVSDMHVFSAFTSSPGYSRPLLQSEALEGEDEALKALPARGELGRIIKGFFDGVDFIITYVRLVDGGPLLKLEIPVQAGHPDPEGLVRWFVGALAAVSVGGYPLPLAEADRGARITREEMVLLAKSLGILPSLTGREVLGTWL